MLVEQYVGNYNIEDGLVNGVEKIFKRYERKKKDIYVVWTEFVDPTIGRDQSNKHSQLFEKDIGPTWKLILPSAKPNTTSRNKSQTSI